MKSRMLHYAPRHFDNSLDVVLGYTVLVLRADATEANLRTVLHRIAPELLAGNTPWSA
jgi:hypothetical protein